MTSVDRREEALFSEALELEGNARVAFLDAECGEDAELRTRVEELLALNDTRDGILDRAPLPVTSPDADLGVGDAVGPYHLEEELGAGGMGVVYRALQHEPVRREVALKLIKPGMDTRSVIARFEGERQALALLDHPGITRVLDAGATASGRPYFVMELCRGKTVTRYAREQELSVEERLELVIGICEAVEHAHQKGILHRDLKPSNILVTNGGATAQPKIIDFGIAKALTEPLTGESSVTYHGQLLGTPEYMSPEQCENGLDVDTRTDVYSLGVILYELLTGVTPVDNLGASPEDIRAAIRAADPVLPSVRLRQRLEQDPGLAERRTSIERDARELRGEIDWIAARALERDRDQRYQSAVDLGRDLRRALAGEPVEAVAPSLGYRVRKTYQRHRVAVLTSAAIALVVTLSAVVSTVLALRLDDSLTEVGIERDRAQEAERQLALSLDRVEEERDRAVAAESQLAELEREQRYRAAVYKAMARYAHESMEAEFDNMTTALRELRWPVGTTPDSGDPIADAMIREIVGDHGPEAMVTVVGDPGSMITSREWTVTVGGLTDELESELSAFVLELPDDLRPFVLDELEGESVDDDLLAEQLSELLGRFHDLSRRLDVADPDELDELLDTLDDAGDDADDDASNEPPE